MTGAWEDLSRAILGDEPVDRQARRDRRVEQRERFGHAVGFAVAALLVAFVAFALAMGALAIYDAVR